jgi:hypothetical protein
MAKFAADSERALALELHKRVLLLNLNLAPLLQAVAGWTLNATDNLLPTPFEVRTAIQQYRTLRLERLRLDDLVDLFLTAQYGDTLTYPAQTTGLLTYNENLIYTPSLMYGM